MCECGADIAIKGVQSRGLWLWVEKMVCPSYMTAGRSDLNEWLSDLLCARCEDTLFTAHKFRMMRKQEKMKYLTAPEYAGMRVNGAVTNVLDKIIDEHDALLAELDQETDVLVRLIAESRVARASVLEVVTLMKQQRDKSVEAT